MAKENKPLRIILDPNLERNKYRIVCANDPFNIDANILFVGFFYHPQCTFIALAILQNRIEKGYETGLMMNPHDAKQQMHKSLVSQLTRKVSENER